MENTQENNCLIAEFMGFIPKEGKRHLLFAPKPYETRMTSQHRVACFIEDLKFHTSWDWLMPVVEKIESIRHIGIDAVYFKIEGKKCQIWTYFDVKEFLRLTGDDKNEGNKFKVGHTAQTKIDATYHAIVDFIKWYNQQKP